MIIKSIYKVIIQDPPVYSDKKPFIMGRRSNLEKKVLDHFFSSLKYHCFSVKYWDGHKKKYGDGLPVFSLYVKERKVAAELVAQPELAFGEGYMNGAIEVTGSLEEVVKLAHTNRIINIGSVKGKLAQKLMALKNKPPSLKQQKKDVQRHYDLGNDFFSLWLDETMSYSCAYFHTPEDSLLQAQQNKIDYVLKKLQLKQGENLLDIGCGWGWLIIKAVQKYGVKAIGITLSEEQYRGANQRIAELKLTNKARVELLDYRLLAEKNLSFDKIASIGMLEHVGKANLPIFMKAIDNLLKPGGLMLLHSITVPKEGPVNPWIDKYIFPGGYIPSLRELVTLLPENEFYPLDIESLRIHYAMTIDKWSENFEKKLEQIKFKFDEKFIRMWRLYLCSSAVSFRHRGLDVQQILFSKGLNNNLALTRDHIYQDNQT